MVRHNIHVDRDEKILHQMRNSSKRSCQITGYFSGEWKLQGFHHGHPGDFIVVMDSNVIPPDVDLLLKPEESAVHTREPPGENTSHLIKFSRGEPRSIVACY